MTLRHISPVFQVADMTRALAFYRDVLGFSVGWQVGEPITHAAVCKDNIEIMLVQSATPVPSHAYINLTGIDEYFARAIRGGARELVPLEDRHYGMRDGRISDPDGNNIGLGQPIHDD